MPDLDGLRTAELIKQRTRNSDTPIILTTTMGSETIAQKAHARGIVDCLAKPLEPIVLRSKTAFYVEQWKREALHRRRWIDAIPIPVWIMDGAGAVKYANRSWSLRDEGVVHSEDAALFRLAWAACLQTGESLLVDLRLRDRPDGEHRVHVVRAAAVKSNGSISEWVLVAAEVNGKRESHSKIAHALRMPLHAILGWAQMLRSGGLDETMRAKAIETIERNARAQAALIANLLDGVEHEDL
jgi:CheY-like chemotaxis protein